MQKISFKPKNKYEQTAEKVYNLLVENFSNTFFVGGMVRDLILNQKITDIDIATSATPDQVIKILASQGLKLNLTGKRFGVVKFERGKQAIEIATFRKEVYKNSRYPKISFTKSLLTDSKRRDFTINSLYFQYKTSTVIDPHKGLKHLETKRVKFIGDANKRIKEDPLRIVRALRFAKQLNFELESLTAKAIENNFQLINKLTQTKLRAEINKSSSQTTKNYLTELLQKHLH